MSKPKKQSKVMVQTLLDPEEESDQEILSTIEDWLPTFEREGLEQNHLIYAMLLHAATDKESFTEAVSAFLSCYRNPKWKFDPWTGKPLPDELDDLDL